MFGKIIWLYGLSGAGKTTLGNRLAGELGFLIMDGDVIRRFLGASKDFSPEARRVHQGRLRSHLNQLRFGDCQGFVVASITPYVDMREFNRAMFKGDYYEVLVDCDLLTAMRRDPKGLYAKARMGEIPYFTGITDTFETGTPDLVVNTSELSEDESYQVLLTGVRKWMQSKEGSLRIN